MIAIETGHVYELKNMENGEVEVQRLTFIKKGLISETGPELETKYNGTTNQEVFAMMIDRLEYLQAIMPCAENVETLKLLHQIVDLDSQRTADRLKREVEGTHQA